MSREPIVVIRFDNDELVFQPGETLSGRYWVTSLGVSDVKAIEVSILWHTEGKGDEDMAVHEFWRRDADDVQPLDPAVQESFRTKLPNSPLSYEGRIIKLRWCVRVRVFPVRGKEIVGERIFQLGNVPAVRTD
jgi:hypothetical protein